MINLVPDELVPGHDAVLDRNRSAWHMLREASQVSSTWDKAFCHYLVSFMLPTGCRIPKAMRGMMSSAPVSRAQHPVTEEYIDHGEEPVATRDQQLLQEHADHEWADGVA